MMVECVWEWFLVLVLVVAGADCDGGIWGLFQVAPSKVGGASSSEKEGENGEGDVGITSERAAVGWSAVWWRDGGLGRVVKERAPDRKFWILDGRRWRWWMLVLKGCGWLVCVQVDGTVAGAGESNWARREQLEKATEMEKEKERAELERVREEERERELEGERVEVERRRVALESERESAKEAVKVRAREAERERAESNKAGVGAQRAGKSAKGENGRAQRGERAGLHAGW